MCRIKNDLRRNQALKNLNRFHCNLVMKLERCRTPHQIDSFLAFTEGLIDECK